MVLGTLVCFDEHYLELRNADLHDLRDADSTRELYVAEARFTGVQRNRKRVMLVRGEVVAVSRLEDVGGRMTTRRQRFRPAPCEPPPSVRRADTAWRRTLAPAANNGEASPSKA